MFATSEGGLNRTCIEFEGCRHCERSEFTPEAIQGVNKELFVGVETPTYVICHPELVSGSYKLVVSPTSQIAFTSLDWEVKHVKH